MRTVASAGPRRIQLCDPDLLRARSYGAIEPGTASIERLVAEHGVDCGFERTGSLCMASGDAQVEVRAAAVEAAHRVSEQPRSRAPSDRAPPAAPRFLRAPARADG